MIKPRFCQVAVPSPLRRAFDYLIPEHMPVPRVGARVLVPFGSRKVVGFVLSLTADSEVPETRLKAIFKLLDQQPLIPEYLFQFYTWVASYYQHPIGNAICAMFPANLRSGKPITQIQGKVLQLTTRGLGLPVTALPRAPKQQQLLNLLQQQPQLNAGRLAKEGISRAVIRQLISKDLAEEVPGNIPVTKPDLPLLAEPPLILNSEQEKAIANVSLDRFDCYLLQGVTGSGKTEVYLQLIESVIKNGQQALVLIPEINLTPQTLTRFNQRFNCLIAVMHSGLTDKERLIAWQQCSTGEASILIGTRSAIFTPLKTPGLIIIDEEHDSSFKQQDGFHYSARDIAVVRAQKENIPILLGSATPSLESVLNCKQARYKLLTLNQRPSGAVKPDWVLKNIGQQQLQAGFSSDLIEVISNTLAQGNQVLVFLNRRGYSPKLSCNDCGWIANCGQCDARYTFHQRQRKLICHHCEQIQPVPDTCPACKSRQLSLSGQGTQKSEETLELLFPDFPVYRVDRDSTRRKQAMADLVDKVNQQQPCILVGTQMLAKGHHFPNVTLVAMLDVDNGLFSPDFRAAEKMGQLITQVAGRCGRGSQRGTVFIQSQYCDHPIITTLCQQGYGVFSKMLLNEREATAMPPFRYMAIIRAEAKTPDICEAFLGQVRFQLECLLPATPSTSYVGPLASAMERKRGQYRYQLTVLTANRNALRKLLTQLTPIVESTLDKRGIKWRIDVDPVESM